MLSYKEGNAVEWLLGWGMYMTLTGTSSPYDFVNFWTFRGKKCQGHELVI